MPDERTAMGLHGHFEVGRDTFDLPCESLPAPCAPNLKQGAHLRIVAT